MAIANVNTITITQEEYNDLLEHKAWAYCLDSAGVDNWEGYEEACEMFREYKESL